jgi:hypothetical protein
MAFCKGGSTGRFFVLLGNSPTDWYNFRVPTPFYHLSLAEQLLKHPHLPEKIGHFLQNSLCGFLFGNTAPDVQVISGQPRQETHFFNLPIQTGDPLAWELILSYHPNLAVAEQLPPLQVAFLAGYLCHLQADWLWVKDIFAPIFGPHCSWGTFRQRLYYHNVLRAYLDMHILPDLHPGLDVCLCRVNPDGWLPFVQDRYLMEWRDLLFPQLQPGADTKTVEVFSARQGISAPDFRTLFESEERMQQEVFEHVPQQLVQRYNQKVLDENVRMLSDYLAFTLHQMNTLIEGNAFQGVHP